MHWRELVSLKLRGKLIALVLLALTPLLVFDAVRIYTRRNVRVEQELAASEELAEAIRAGFQSYLSSLWSVERAVGHTIIGRTEPMTTLQIETLLQSQVSRHPYVSAFAWLSPEGIVLASTDPTIRGADLSGQEHVHRVMHDREAVVSNLLPPLSGSSLHFAVLQAVFSHGELQGIVLARVNAERLGELMPLRRLGSRSFGLVDRNGTVVFQDGDLPQHLRKADPEGPVWEALRGDVGKVRRYVSSENGREQMGVAVPIGEIGWAVFASTSVSEVLGEAWQGALQDLLILLVVGGASILGALALGRRFIQPLVALQQAAAALERGNLSARVKHFSRDELGVTSQMFDHMAGQMEESERRLQDRLRQHEALVAIGQLLMSGTDIPELMDKAVRLVGRALQVEFCKVVELKPGDPALLLRAGIGWKEELVGNATLPAESESQSGYTLRVMEPVVVTDLRAETRFRSSPLMREHGAVSGISVIIPGPDRPFGALGAHSSRPRVFTQDDVHFLRAVAHSLATALARRSYERRLATGHWVTRILAELRTASEAQPLVLRAIGEGLGWDLATCWMLDEATGVARCAYIWHRESEALAGFAEVCRQITLQVGREEPAPGWITLSPGWSEDVACDSRYFRREAAKQAGLHAAFWVPVMLDDEVHGFIECFSTERRFRDEALLRSMTALGSQVGQFIKRKRAEEELRALNACLEQRVEDRTAELAAANQELEAFSYSVSHDLRAPLRTVDGFGQALLEDFGTQLPPEGLDYLRRIRAATRRMEQLIDDLLRLSRLMRADMRREVVDLTRLAQETAAELARVHPDRRVAVDIQPGMMAVGDERLLRVVMENLLDNAWKFTASVPDALVTVGMNRQEEGPVYFVRDNGTGFDMAYVDKIFVPFQRLHPAGTFEGHGIGLATVNRVLHRHGGRVWAEGAVGQGAVFSFTVGRERRDGPTAATGGG